MKLLVKREKSSQFSTIGEMFINNEPVCFTLEDVVREVKIPGETAIPKGKYEISLTYSNRFKKVLPLIHDVPNFTGVRIHPGNKAEDTEGCILVGLTRDHDFIGSSRLAFAKVMGKLMDARDRGDKTEIEIVDV